MSNAENIFSQYTNLEKGKIRIGGGNSLIKSLILTPMIEFTKKSRNRYYNKQWNDRYINSKISKW